MFVGIFKIGIIARSCLFLDCAAYRGRRGDCGDILARSDDYFVDTEHEDSMCQFDMDPESRHGITKAHL